MEKVSEVKFNLVRTLKIIENNEDLTFIFRKKYNTPFSKLYSAAKENKLNTGAVEYIKGIFLGIITEDEELLYKYKITKMPSGFDIEDIDIPVLDEPIEPEVQEEETVIDSMSQILQAIDDKTITDEELYQIIKNIREVKTNPLKLPSQPEDSVGMVLNSKRPTCADIHVKAIKQQFYTENDRLLLRGLQLNNLYCSIQAKASKQKFTDTEAKTIKGAIDTLNRVVTKVLTENTKNNRKK